MSLRVTPAKAGRLNEMGPERRMVYFLSSIIGVCHEFVCKAPTMVRFYYATGERAGWSLPGELGVVVEGGGEDVDVLRDAGRGGEGGQRGEVEAGDVGDVVEVDVLEEVAVLEAVFDADVLMLVVEVFGPLGEAD